jgi:hypothetical protein
VAPGDGLEGARAYGEAFHLHLLCRRSHRHCSRPRSHRHRRRFLRRYPHTFAIANSAPQLMASDDHSNDHSEDLSDDLRDDLRLITYLMTNLIRCCTRSRSLPTKRGTPREALRLATSEVGRWDTLPRTCCSECRQWPIGKNGCAFAALLGYRLERTTRCNVGFSALGRSNMHVKHYVTAIHTMMCSALGRRVAT